ncbi:MAG: serine/threonine protein kinase [Wenzhouxiangellaceae bacterium]|nr:MAG: serine/threonine protein kinase [Wenzhouxiangellaceae bacterium]
MSENHDNGSDQTTYFQTEGSDRVPAEAQDWKAGQRLGPFRLIRQLGSGGMGLVWLAEQLEPLQREVAIKVLKAGEHSVLAEAYFEIERQSLAQLSHRAIAQIHDAGQLPGGGLFFAMEYVRGVPLDQYLQTHRLNGRDLASLMLEICAGVQHAHQRGLIHRDLKPQNIIVQEEDNLRRPKIIDFGIAVSLSKQESPDDTRHPSAGTRAYMAPEQSHQEPGGIDVRTDVYGLGAVLAESLLICDGIGTFKQQNIDSTTACAKFHSGLGRRSPLNANEDHFGSLEVTEGTDPLAAELRAISTLAMAPNRELRYPSVSAMAEDLRRFLEHEPVKALTGGRLYKTQCFLRRHALASVAAGLIGLSVLVGTGMMSYGLTQAQQGRAEAESALELAEQRRTDAEALIRFMLGDFATQLRPIGRLDLLDDIASEAMRYLAEQPITTDAESALNRARALRTLGEVQVHRQRPEQARQVLVRAEELLTPWHNNLDPKYADLHFESGQIAFWLGMIAFRERDWAETEQLWLGYLDHARRYRQSGADDISSGWELAYAHNNLGALAEARDRPLDALEYFQQAAGIRQELVDPADAADKLGLANNLSWIGRVQNSLGESVQAWASSAEALNMVTKASLDHPDDARLLRAEINFRLILARFSERLDMTDAAQSLLSRAVTLARRDVANDPTHARRQAMLTLAALMYARTLGPNHEHGPATLELGRQSLEVARELGLDARHSVELPALSALATLEFNPDSTEHARVATQELKRLANHLESGENVDDTWLPMLELATLLIITLDQSDQEVDPDIPARLVLQLNRVPQTREKDLRYRLASSVLPNPGQQDRLDAITRFNDHLTGLQAEITGLPVFMATLNPRPQ